MITHKITEGSVVFVQMPLTGKSVLARVIRVYGNMLSCRYIKATYENSFEVDIKYVKAIEPSAISRIRDLLNKNG